MDWAVPPRVAANVPVVSEMSILKVDVEIADTVLSALTRTSVIALGLARVKRLAPTVVAPRFVLATVALLAPVPPETTERALPRFKVVTVEVPLTIMFPSTASLALGVVDPIPTLPLFKTVKRLVTPEKSSSTLPAPVWTSENNVLVVLAVVVPAWSFRRSDVEATPPTV